MAIEVQFKIDYLPASGTTGWRTVASYDPAVEYNGYFVAGAIPGAGQSDRCNAPGTIWTHAQIFFNLPMTVKRYADNRLQITCHNMTGARLQVYPDAPGQYCRWRGNYDYYVYRGNGSEVYATRYLGAAYPQPYNRDLPHANVDGLFGSFTLQPGQATGQKLYGRIYNHVNGNNWRWYMRIVNTYPRRAYTNPTIDVNCGQDGNTQNAKISASVNYGVGERPNNTAITVSKNADFSNPFKTYNTSATNPSYVISGLAVNSKYYTRWVVTNGSRSVTKTCEFVTVTTNKLTDPKSDYWNRGTVRLAIQMGDNYYKDPSTEIYIRKCGVGSWTLNATSMTKSIETVNLTNLEPETCYEVQARTTTPAGTYHGNIVQFTTPKKNLTAAEFTKIEPAIHDTTWETYADVCYKWKAEFVPAEITVYYRVKDGFDDTWKEAEPAITVNDYEGTYCFVLHDLFPNQTVYEMYIHTETDGNPWDSGISQFITPLLLAPEICTCDTFDYLLDLLCQAIKPLYSGNKTIYANPATKELCDPDSNNPTLATLWSRIIRFDHAVTCLVCDMMDLLSLKNGNPDQYLVGEIGWVTMVSDIIEGEEVLAESGVVAEYIEEKLHEVWHYHGDVDYLVGRLNEAPTTGISNGTTMITASTSKLYKYNGSSWVEDTTFDPHNFSVYHINNFANTSFGRVEAGSAYFYFEGTWNNLDADLAQFEARLVAMEQLKKVFPQSTTEDEISIRAVPANFDYSTLPNNRRTICFVIEGL